MSKKDNREQAGGKETRMILGFNRDQRFRFYRWLGIAIVLFGGVWMFAYLQPQRWYKSVSYTHLTLPTTPYV